MTAVKDALLAVMPQQPLPTSRCFSMPARSSTVAAWVALGMRIDHLVNNVCLVDKVWAPF